MTRDERQDISVEKFISASGIGTIEAATGFGKTRIALRIIQYLRRSVSERKVIIVVPNDHLKNQWVGLLREWKLDKYSTVHIINSFIKSKHSCSLLILDECHRYAADTFNRVFDVAQYRFVLGLTAMIKRLDRKQHLITKYCPVVDRITLVEARLNEWISPYREFNLAIQMAPDEAREYDVAEKMYNDAMGTFQWDFGLLRRAITSYKPRKIFVSGVEEYVGSVCEELAREYGWKGNSPKEAYVMMVTRKPHIWGSDMTHIYHPEKLMVKAINGMKAMSKMKKIIHSSPGKVRAAVEILTYLDEMKAITFAELTNTADQMTALTSHSASYHTKSKIKDPVTGKTMSSKKGKDYIVKMINSGEIKRIHTAKAMDEGADFPEISLGIRISGTSSPTQQTQRRGRIVRKHEGKEAVMVNLYLKRTKEKQWLEKSQGNSEDVEWIESIEELIDQLTPDGKAD